MLEVRRSGDRGYADHGWLKTYHSFSFADYYDPVNEEFGPLRVINEDRVKPGKGFASHAHRDMEILTYVLEGELEHKDSLGNGSVVRRGDVQRMTAGTGVTHSEFNSSPAHELHLLQIWIKPNVTGIPPGYEQKSFADADKRGRLCPIASPAGVGGSVTIHQDAHVYCGRFALTERAEVEVAKARRAYVHVVRGSIAVNETRLNTGDAVKISRPGSVLIQHGRDAEVLVFDLP